MVFPPRPEGPPPPITDLDEGHFPPNYGKSSEKKRPPGPPPDDEDDNLVKIKKKLSIEGITTVFPTAAKLDKVNEMSGKNKDDSPAKQKNTSLSETIEPTQHLADDVKITTQDVSNEDSSALNGQEEEGKGKSASKSKSDVDMKDMDSQENISDFRQNNENQNISKTNKSGPSMNYSKGRRPPPGLPPPTRDDGIEKITKNENRKSVISKQQENISKTDVKVEEKVQKEEIDQMSSEEHDKESDDDSTTDQNSNSKSTNSDEINQRQPFHAWEQPPRSNSFPGIDADKEIDPDLRETLRPGRLSIRCIKAENIRRKDQTTGKANITPYLSFKLGGGNGNDLAERKTKGSKQAGENPTFENEVVSFDIENPVDYFTNNDVKLLMKLYDKSAWSEYLLGETTMSAKRLFFLQKNSDEWLPLIEDGDSSSNSKVNLEFGFEEVKTGMLVIKICECKNIQTQTKTKRAINSFVKVCIGDGVGKRTKTAEDGGSNPYFGEEEILLWVDKTNWFENLKAGLHVSDEAGDTFVGGGDVSLLPYMSDIKVYANEKEDIVPLTNTQEIDPTNILVGELKMRLNFLEAGELKANILRAKYLREVGMIGQMDPYILIKTDGNSSSLKEATKPDKDGGTDPTWNEELTFMVVDHHKVEIECYDHDVLTNVHEKIGSAHLSLLPVYKTGYIDIWVQLKHENEFGVNVDAGQVNITFDFIGPRGVAFPRYQPSMASFDDTHRVHKRGKLATKEEPVPKQSDKIDIEPLAQDIVEDGPVGDKNRDECEFSEEDIRGSFEILDLDKNGYLGASEIRHILICMGEQVTDEEIDMMISMLDANGDGQVSYDEFRLMVIDPDPARDDFTEDVMKKNKSSVPIEDATAIERKKEIEKRNIKRRVLSQFIATNRIRKVDIMRIWDMYREKDEFKNIRDSVEEGSNAFVSSCLIDYVTFCDLLTVVEPTGETKEVFGLFDCSGSGKIDVRELVLSLSNFVASLSVEERCRFMFDMFDIDRSGFLSLTEVECMLVGNHMQSQKAVAKKAQTVMKCADTDNSGGITFQELLVAAAKFPNLLLPAHPTE